MNNPNGWLEFGVYLPNFVGKREGTEKVPMGRTHRFLWERQIDFLGDKWKIREFR